MFIVIMVTVQQKIIHLLHGICCRKYNVMFEVAKFMWIYYYK